MRNYAVIAVLAFGMGVLVALLVSGGGGPRADAPRAPEGRSDDSAALDRAARLQERLKTAEAQKEDLTTRVEYLTRRLRQHEKPAEGEDDGAGGAQHAPGRTRFVYPGMEKSLSGLNWDEAGEAAAGLTQLLSEAGQITRGKKEMRAGLWGDILKTMGPLITQGLTLEERGVPWSHPAYAVNLIHATLRKAGHPLSEKQEEELYRIGMRFIEEDGRRRASYSETTPRLRQQIEDGQIQDRLFAAVRTILNEPQKGVLYPPGVRGIVGLDAFSGGGVWDEHMDRVVHKDRAELREKCYEWLADELKLRPGVQPVLKNLVAQWEASLPDAFVFAAPDAIRMSEDMEPSARVFFAAQRQLKIYEALLAQAPLTAEERERILEHQDVLLPLLKR